MAEPAAGADGQAAPADQTATVAAPTATQGQSAQSSQATQRGSDGVAVTEESFFDPKSIADKPELMQAYKQMQKDYTKGKQAIRAAQQKIEAYDRAMQDPHGTIRALAQQYGLSVIDGKPNVQGDQEFAPKSWDDVIAYAKQQVLGEISPLVNEVKGLKQRSIESHFDSEYPDWRQYEDQMVGVLKQHPTLANDPDTLYRMSVPQEVVEARAYNKALQKLKNGNDAAKAGGAIRTTQATSEKPTGALTLNQAYEFARNALKGKGLAPQ